MKFVPQTRLLFVKIISNEVLKINWDGRYKSEYVPLLFVERIAVESLV